MAKGVLHYYPEASYIAKVAIGRYSAVKRDSAQNTVDLATADTDVVIGITDDTTDIAAGDPVTVIRGGFALAKV